MDDTIAKQSTLSPWCHVHTPLGPETSHRQRDHNTIKASDQEKTFACPFFKHDSSIVSQDSVSGRKFRNCCKGFEWRRLKEHLARAHCQQTPACQRCGQTFTSSEQLQHHYQQVRPCQPGTAEHRGIIRPDVAQQILKKSRPGQSSFDQWYNAWRLIFPGQLEPTTPYIDGVESAVMHLSHILVASGEPAATWLRSLNLPDSTQMVVDNAFRRAYPHLMVRHPSGNADESEYLHEPGTLKAWSPREVSNHNIVGNDMFPTDSGVDLMLFSGFDQVVMNPSDEYRGC